MPYSNTFRTICFSFIVSSFLLCLNAQAQTIEAQKLQTAPVIDGKLDDITWQQLTPIEEFIIAEFETTVPDRTQVYIGYDDVAIYFGFQCFQPKSTIITTQTRRDGSFQFEDHVAAYLDTYHDRRRTYCFAVNPIGTQRDEKQGDLGWDSEWIAAANIEDSVWTVEMKIPYQLLDLPRTAKQTWGLNLVRRHQSIDRTSTWADTGINVTDANEFGSLTNLEFNPQNIRKKLQLLTVYR